MTAFDFVGGPATILYQLLLVVAGWTFHRRLRNRPARFLFFAALAVFFDSFGRATYVLWASYHYGVSWQPETFASVDGALHLVVVLLFGWALVATARSVRISEAA